MHSSLFFRLFPPPTFLVMPHAGLDISDDGLRCIEYRRSARGLRISKHASHALPPGLIDGGDIKDEKQFASILTEFIHKNGLVYAKVSLPEEKAYLFQTDVPTTDFRSIAQNIEFKLEQNVPLSATDALFQFDLMPSAVTGNQLRASVSVVPRSYVERYVSILRSSGVSPVAFEVVPKAVASSCVSERSQSTDLIVHVMKKKTGLYIVSEGVVCFTSTIAIGEDAVRGADQSTSVALMSELDRVNSYWVTRSDVHTGIKQIVIVGSSAKECDTIIKSHGSDAIAPSVTPDVWSNAFSVDSYVPPVTLDDSLEYAVAAGLAL